MGQNFMILQVISPIIMIKKDKIFQLNLVYMYRVFFWQEMENAALKRSHQFDFLSVVKNYVLELYQYLSFVTI